MKNIKKFQDFINEDSINESTITKMFGDKEYKFTDTPTMIGVKMLPIPVQAFDFLKKDLNDESKVEELENGWVRLKVKSYGGEVVLYSLSTKEMVCLDHQQGGRMGSVMWDFVKNNPIE